MAYDGLSSSPRCAAQHAQPSDIGEARRANEILPRSRLLAQIELDER